MIATMLAGRGLAVSAAMAALALGLAAARAQQPAPPSTSPPGKSDKAEGRGDASAKRGSVTPAETAYENIPLDKIKVPAGFRVAIWAHGLPGARTLLRGAKGTVFVGTRALGRVYAITDRDGTREVRIVAQGLNSPNGLAMKDGALLVFAINKVLRYDGIEDALDNVPQPVDLSARFDLPADAQHGWKFVAFGPDGKLYVPVGANCDICAINRTIYGQIRRYNADGSGMEVVARGIRNTAGFDWHPVTKELWFADNGRGWPGDDGPQDELNRLPNGHDGADFGFPYCHANGIPDPSVKRANPCAGVMLPAALLGPHSAALGVTFYTGKMFPASYKNVAFIARRGAWSRTKMFGFDVVVARPTADGKATVEPFMTGLLDEKSNSFLGRPVQVLQMPDGAVLVSDENNGAIYRISYDRHERASQ